MDCDHCNAASAQCCAHCKTPYCSPECQKISWIAHKFHCKAASAQRRLAIKTSGKVFAFLNGAYRFEDRHEAGKIIPPSELVVSERYNVYWEWDGETGETLWWKFRGDSGLGCCIDSMDEGMVYDRENAGLLGCASSNWTQVFYDMFVNYTVLGTVFPLDLNDGPHQTEQIKQTARRWDEYLARAKANQFDIDCMFTKIPVGCLAPKGTCLFAHPT